MNNPKSTRISVAVTDTEYSFFIVLEFFANKQGNKSFVKQKSYSKSVTGHSIYKCLFYFLFPGKARQTRSPRRTRATRTSCELLMIGMGNFHFILVLC